MPTEKVINLNNLDRYDKNLKTVAGILQRSTEYALGDVVHNKNIYLKCTTAGTTKATTLDLTNVAKDDTVTDGTVVWTVTSTTGPASGESSGAGLEDWQVNHNYAVDDIYVYEGEIYKTLVKFTSGATEDSRTEINDIVPSVWASNTEYTAGQIIEHTDVTTLKKVYYNVTSNFTSGATFEVTTEMQELQIVEEYVPNPLTKQQVKNLINNFVPSGSGTEPIFYNDSPIGTIISYMGITAPKDYLACDGTVYNIADYRELAEYIKRQFGNYNFFGGDGTTTFAVPDLRGEFLRGTGTNSHSGNGNGAEVGVHQDATTVGDFVVEAGGTNGMYAPLTTKGGFATNADSVTLKAKPTDSADTVTGRYYFAKGGNDSYTGDSGGSLKTTRPTNTSVLYCIKYNTSVLSTPENNYSTEEQRIGTWVDGKPLYQITIQDTMPVVTTDGTRATKNIDISNLRIDKCICIEAFIFRYENGGYRDCIPFDSINNTSLFSHLEVNRIDYSHDYSDNLFCACSRTTDNNRPFYATLKYTKTTD